MSDQVSRRRAISLAMVALGCVSGSLANPALAAQHVAIPPAPMRLRRKLVRSLAKGRTLSVARAWKVTFAAQGSGIAITGEQLSANVEAPEALAALARIEQERSTASMFPILLDANGTIMAIGSSTSEATLADAVREAEEIIAARNLDEATQAEQRRFINDVTNSGAMILDRMPGDLFYPSVKPVRQIREVVLPDGAKGEFELNWTAARQEAQPWLARARREVITRIGDSEQRSSEEWQLAAL
ncbi:MAG: hypothetical protein AAF127_05420 [Pseudomonadota bacterium]